MVAGAASNNIKNTLKMLGIDSGICRRVAIITYEAEINLVIHAGGGMLKADIFEDHVVLIAGGPRAGHRGYRQGDDGGLHYGERPGARNGLRRWDGAAEYKAQQRRFQYRIEVGVGTTLTCTVHFNKK